MKQAKDQAEPEIDPYQQQFDQLVSQYLEKSGNQPENNTTMKEENETEGGPILN